MQRRQFHHVLLHVLTEGQHNGQGGTRARSRPSCHRGCPCVVFAARDPLIRDGFGEWQFRTHWALHLVALPRPINTSALYGKAVAAVDGSIQQKPSGWRQSTAQLADSIGRLLDVVSRFPSPAGTHTHTHTHTLNHTLNHTRTHMYVPHIRVHVRGNSLVSFDQKERAVVGVTMRTSFDVWSRRRGRRRAQGTPCVTLTGSGWHRH